MSNIDNDLLEDDVAHADTETPDAKLTAATLSRQANSAKAREVKAAKDAARKSAGQEKSVQIPKPMVELADPRKNVARAAPRPSLEVTGPPGHEDDAFDDSDAKTPAPAPRRKAAKKPAGRKKEYTPAQLAILDQIRTESESRVNVDDFLATKDKDQHHVPEHLIPDGFAVEWKNTHVSGKPVDSTYNAAVQSAGWRPAPTEIFGELVPEGYDLPFIEKAGSMLMIRPIEISEAIKDAEYQAAIGQVQDKMASLTQAPAKENPRHVTAFSRDYESRKIKVMQDN